MYKVYIVDDDELILNEIIETVPWMDNGFEVVGSSASPTDALRQIPLLRPRRTETFDENARFEEQCENNRSNVSRGEVASVLMQFVKTFEKK